VKQNNYKTPFPWFGGKSRVADVVWAALGEVTNYVEPFFGSGAVLMLRPDGAGKIETVNDADGFVANFWRALQYNPEQVAHHADWPVNECDLHARHLWLVGQRERITERLMGDSEWYDAKAAGWWAWGQSCWIGSGWCSGKGPWTSVDGVFTHLGNAGRGVNRQLPHLGDAGQGVNRQLPHLGCAGRGVNRQLPHLGDAGQGVNRQLPHLGCAGQGVKRQLPLAQYLQSLADRLRNVRVCCGDWSRVCGPCVTHKHGLTGVFLDPPYSAKADRDGELYAVESLSVAHDVREWAIEAGQRDDMRIVLAGYDGEHELPGWRKSHWKALGGYGNQGKSDSRGKRNRHRETLWFSPACLETASESQGLFAEAV